MTQTSRFHDVTSNTDVHFAETFSSVHLDGVDAGSLNALKAYAATPNAMTVLIPTGIAWVQGRWYKNDAVVTMTIDPADATYTRYDRIVLRSTVAGSPGSIVLTVIKGTAAAAPVLPDLTQTAGVWDIPLCYVNVTATLAAVTDAHIFDQRKNLPSGSLGYVIDGGGVEITDGSKGFIQVPFSCKITGWTVLADADASIVVDIKSQAVAAWPADSTSTASIAGTDKPTLSGKKIARSFALTGWTTAVAEGDIIEFNVDSCTTITRATVQLHFVRTN
jgi:hypothetical protein